MEEPLEIEKKFLIYRPEEALLDAQQGEKWEIWQAYLNGTPEQGSRRVRRVRSKGAETWYYSEKLRLTDMTRIEREREITPEEAADLLKEADAGRRPIEKLRWRIPYEERTLEIDTFPFWEHQAFCEVELPDEGAAFSLPEWVRVIRDVSADRRYNNNNLARAIPEEEEIFHA